MGEHIKFHGDIIINDKHGKPLRAITEGQQRLLESIQTNDIIFVNGPAGTGKTVISTWYGIAGIENGTYNNLVLTRPIIEAGEELGFLPGTFDEKVAPYMQPLYDAIEVVKGKRLTQEMANKIEAKTAPSVSNYRKKKVAKGEMEEPKRKPKIESNDDFYKKVHVCPLAYLRGSTKSHSFIIIDEAQNITRTQMKLALTRIGYGSKLVICGDKRQSDLKRMEDSGFRHAQEILQGVRGIDFVQMGIEDIVRHRLIKDIILRYEGIKKDKGLLYTNRENMDEYDFSEDDAED